MGVPLLRTQSLSFAPVSVVQVVQFVLYSPLCSFADSRVARMEREGASSSSSRPNRSNQQESGGEHPAWSNARSLKIFDAGDLHFFDRTAEDADEASLRKSYFRKSLCIHPDKGGSTEAFQDLGFLYEKLKQGFKTLRSLQRVKPNLTVASVTTSAKNNDHNPRVASETAPAWNVRDILQLELPHVKDAVKGFVPYQPKY